MAARSATTLRSALRSRTLNHARYMSYYPSEEPALPINTILNVVPQQEAWVVERFGRFQQILKPGLNVLVPLVDRIAYRHDLKEVAREWLLQGGMRRIADNWHQRKYRHRLP